MDNGEISLRAELGKMENPEEIKKLAEDAEMSGYEDVAKMAQDKLVEIKAQSESVLKTTESQVRQVESVGGNEQEIASRTEGVDQKIAEVQALAAKEIEEVKSGKDEGVEKVEDLESFTIPFEEHKYTIEISSEEDYYKAAEKLKKLGYVFNGGGDLMAGIDNQFVKPPYKLIIENDSVTGTKGKVVTYIRKGTGKNY